MAQQLEDAIIKLRAALRATAWADHELTAALVREARDACEGWLTEIGDVRTSVGAPEPARPWNES